MADADPEAVRRALEKLLVSDQLGKSETSRKLLTYLVERSTRNDPPKEAEIAIDVFGKDASFNAGEDSVVRVGVRTLRQKLAEYYAGAGATDELQFVVPKGGYRLTVMPRATEAEPSLHSLPPARASSTTRWAWIAGIALALLVLSAFTNVYLWNRTVLEDPTEARIQKSAVWSEMVKSRRPLTIVLGDLFMFTQVDPRTGRTQTVRDTGINSSEELRAFLASNPSFAANLGQRYVTLIQQSAAVSMAAILQIVDRPGRRIEVKVRDELQVDDIRNNDIIYVGPLVRLGALSGYYQLKSRYRYDAERAGVVDTVAQKTFLPEGRLGDQHVDYALAAKFDGPSGNHIMIFTSGGRNAGLLQIVRTLTSPASLEALETRLRAKAGKVPNAFEALMTVTGFKTTDLTAEIVDVNALPASHLQNSAALATP